MKKVSIIVPAFNAERYICRCVQSLLNQTLSDIEIIIVDDGSTDNTYHICERFKEIDERVILVHQENAGVAAARNRGLEYAKGEFIGFVDSDDFVESNMYEILYSVASKTMSDIVNCDFEIIQHEKLNVDLADDTLDDVKLEISITREQHLPKTSEVLLDLLDPQIQVLSKEDINTMIETANKTRVLWFVWKGIYSNKMIKDNDIRFIENLKLGEETPFVLECMLCSQTIAVVPDMLYYYVHRNGSMTNVKHQRGYFNILNDLYKAKRMVYEKHSFKGYEADLNSYTMEHTIPMILSNEIKSGKSIRNQMHEFKNMRNSEMIKEAYKDASPIVIRSKLRYLALLLKYRQYLLLSVLCQ